jgi:prepilin-type N-terminal cleavage/methylation domain-containing protein/prepilin-type processing-associated H-X9-DG protein
MHLPPRKSAAIQRADNAEGGISTRGMTLIETICVVAVLVVLTGFILPLISTSHRHVGWIKCVNNLKNVGLSYRIYASDNQDRFPFQVSTNAGGTLELRNDVFAQFRILSNELSTPKILLCPRMYRAASEATNWSDLNPSNVSYYVGLTASESNTNSILSGDTGFNINQQAPNSGLNQIRSADVIAYPKNFHDGTGRANVLRADGSVLRPNNKEWPNLLSQAATPKNLFVFP